jgi:TLP18.3/Psb32/MOLO-1 phosphatase superfamily protein
MRRVLIALGALAVLLMGAGPAWADVPVEVDGQLTDRARVLGSDAGAVRAALERLRTEEGIAVYVVLVSGFDEPGEPDWATTTASESLLEDKEMLLAIDVAESDYEWWMGESFSVPFADVEGLIASRVAPLIADGAWTDGVLALTDGLASSHRTFLGGAAEARGWSGTTTAVVCAVVLLTLGGTHLLARRRTGASSAP